MLIGVEFVRYDGEIDSANSHTEPSEVLTSADGVVTKIYADRRQRWDADGNLISQYIRTTPGRIIYNQAVVAALS